MPGPDPQGLDIEEHPDGSFTITAEVGRNGDRKHRLACMFAVSGALRLMAGAVYGAASLCRSAAGPTRDIAAMVAAASRCFRERGR